MYLNQRNFFFKSVFSHTLKRFSTNKKDIIKSFVNILVPRFSHKNKCLCSFSPICFEQQGVFESPLFPRPLAWGDRAGESLAPTLGLETLHTHPCNVHCTVHCAALCSVQYTVLHCAVYSTPRCTVQCTVHRGALCTVEYTALHCAVYSTPRCTGPCKVHRAALGSVQYTALHWAVYSTLRCTVHCTAIYTVYCTLHKTLDTTYCSAQNTSAKGPYSD